MLPQRISFQPSVGRSMPSDLLRAMPEHWQLRELAGAYAKWGVMGRFRPFERPLWSTFIWRLEFVNALYEFLATPLALGALQGTPFLPWYFRLLGARIGRGVYAH